jgi:archaemetzincin
MESVSLVAVAAGNTALDMALLDRLAARLAAVFRVSVTTSDTVLDVDFAYTPERRQYYSTKIVAALATLAKHPGEHILGITSLDLFVPVLTFVFGEAQLRGPAAIVSYHRLTEGFYGLPEDEAKLDQRILKEAVHELGHTLGLRHCDDWSCAMASTHTVELLDLKRPELCAYCRRE